MSKRDGEVFIFNGTLEQRLGYALSLFSKGGERSQEGVILALTAVDGFVRQHAYKNSPDGDRLMLPINELVVALLERQCGKGHPLLDFKKARGGNALLISEADFQMISCFVVDLLEWSGVARDKAFVRVANSLATSGFYQPRKKTGNRRKIEAVTVKGWHKGRDRSYEVGSFKESGDMLEWVQEVCRGHVGPAELPFENMTPAIAQGIADVILRQVIPVKYGHLRPGR